MTYRLHYWSQDVDSTTWSVYAEQYKTAEHHEPLDGTQQRISTWPNEADAEREARRLQHTR